MLYACIWWDFYGISLDFALHNCGKYSQKPCFLEMGPCFIRVIHLINLTGEKRYVTELKWIWLVIVSGNYFEPRGDQYGISIQSLIKLGKPFFQMYRTDPDSWLGLLYVSSYIVSFPRFWTFCIEWFTFLVLMAWQWKQRIDELPILKTNHCC